MKYYLKTKSLSMNCLLYTSVQSESAIISNTIFFAITILPFLKEYGSKITLDKKRCR